MRFIKDKDAAGRQPGRKKCRRGRLLRGVPGLSLLLTFALVLAAGELSVRTYTQERWYGDPGETEKNTWFAFPSNTESKPSVISLGDGNLQEGFLTELTIWDKDGKQVETGGTLYVGEKYKIKLQLSESGNSQGRQFTWTEDGKMTYHIPKVFSVTPRDDMPLWITIDGEPFQVGTYSVDADGVITITLTEEGQKKLDEAYDIDLQFEMEATAQKVPDGGDGKLHFDEAGKDFTFEMTDQPQISVEKEGHYTENEDKKGGMLEYTVKTTVEKDKFRDATVTDVLTPPQSKALELNMVEENGEPKVTVKVKKKGIEEEIELGPEDYELLPVDPDPENPYQKQSFQVKLKEGGDYNPLEEGDELYVTYNYKVDYKEGTTGTFWGNVLNTATVTGTIPMEKTDGSGKTEDIPVTESRESNVEIFAVPPGHGVVFKTEDYSEKTKTLHYTLYTVVPAGTWSPLYIQDDMVVEYNGKRWYLSEFKEGGRVKDLKVSAVDVENWFDDWEEGTADRDKIQDLEELKESAHLLNGYDFIDEQLDGYEPDNLDQYVYRYGETTLNIIFGLDKGRRWGDGVWGNWGHWSYGKDRLIITEYDLNMSELFGETVELTEMNGDEKLTLPPDQVLLAGIKNNVNLRFGGYYPGYSVFFNNADRMNKVGTLDKNTSTIEYTVTINTTDSTVRGYFEDVSEDWYAQRKSVGSWDANQMYPGSMKAVFYDVLPDGWKYVEGSLSVTTQNIDKSERYFVYGAAEVAGYKEPLVKEKGEKEVIEAPLVFFFEPSRLVEGGEGMELYNMLGSNLTKLTFTYKLQATEEWLKAHATDINDTEILNHAEITDVNGMHWDADETVHYFPASLTKVARQVTDKDGNGTNLLQFTLKVNNPGGKNLDPNKDYLIVTDTSTNLQIQLDSIKVSDESGKPLTQKNPEGYVDINNPVNSEQWGMLPPTEEEGQFKLMVPDEKALTIQYNALITQQGIGVKVSNTADIEGVNRSNTSYEDSLRVDKIDGSGEGTTHTLTMKKIDKSDPGRQLEGAEFEFYIVLTEGSSLYKKVENGTGKITEIKGYKCYSVTDGWKITTDENGSFVIPSAWELSPGNYYILKETKAPEGYVLPEEDDRYVIFYYDYFENEIDRETYPNAKFINCSGDLPLTISNEPITYELPETGGSGTSAMIFTGALLILAGGAVLLRKRRAA